MNVTEFATKHNLVIAEIKSVPLQPGEKGFRYLVTLQLAGKGSIVTIPYFCGSAYVGIPRKEVVYDELNSNSAPRYKTVWKMLSQQQLENYEKQKSFYQGNAKPIPPQLGDVLNCLLMDYCLLESSPFWPEYAFEMGLNEDSIKERTKYDEVVKQFIAFRKMLGYTLTSEFLKCDSE